MVGKHGKTPLTTWHDIAAIRDSEARFRSIFENAAVGIARVAPDGRFLEVNQRLCDIIGYSREELMAKTFGEITHPDDLEQDLSVMRRMLAGEIDTYLREKRYFRKDGSVVWVNLSVSLLRDADGLAGYFISVIEDISARKRAEETLRENEARFKHMADTAPAMLWVTEPDGRCTFLSRGWYEFTGQTEQEALGKRGFGWLDAVHPDDREESGRVFLEANRKREPFTLDYRLRRADGEYRWAIDAGRPRFDEEGVFLGYVGSVIDITERRENEISLRESQERLAGIVSSAMDAIITVDDDQRIVLINEAAERMFGCSAAEAIGQRLDRFIPERFRNAHAEHLRRFGETGGTGAAMGRLTAITALRADGVEFPIEASISKIEVGGRKLYTVVHRDITERKQAEAEREQLAREQVARATAEAANRSKDEFLAMVSHELRSPLNAILGYTRMLRSGMIDRDAIDNVAAIIERSAEAQLRIIEDLFDSARIITGKLQIEPGPVDLVPALESALDTVRAAAEAKGVTLVARFSSQPEQVLGDSTRLQQVVWNLLTNAVKFTPEGGRVELRMEGADDNVRITVSDTGKGIEPEFLPFIFDPLRQADSSSARRFGGLGLGLSLVKHLVELHGGTITAASEGAGRGAEFTVTLPRRQFEFIAASTPAVAPREVRLEDAIPLDRDLSLEGLSVLVVDDQEEARELLTQALSDYGAHVTAVSSGVEALAFLSDPPSGKRPDALILDIAMPNEDGYTVLKKARALQAAQGGAEADQIPAIALTAYGRSEDRLRALQAGFHMHVAKPVEPAELAVVIANLTTRRAWERKRKL
jgi:PAS domain S-box-containing protein